MPLATSWPDQTIQFVTSIPYSSLQNTYYGMYIRGIFNRFCTFIFSWETVRVGGVVIGRV